MANRADGESIEESNRRKVLDYYRAGAKAPADCTHLGVEVEHFVLADDGRPIAYDPGEGLHGVSEVLEALCPFYPQASYSAEGKLIGLAGEEGSVTLEPAAQLELSAAPYSNVADIERAFANFYRRVDDIIRPWGCHLQAAGYHPTRKALELALIPKRRYAYMNDYFAHIGSHGERMMRGSASTQVSVDFSSEEDAVRKMRVAAALAPVLAAIMDNTHVFEGAPNHVPVRRLQLWREVDHRRCGTPRGLFEDGYTFGAYVDWLLDTPPIYVDRPAAADPEGPAMRAAYDTPAREAYADAPLAKADIEHLESMFWPDVRLKRFVEVRPADSVPLPQVLGYAALIEGLFYSEGSCAAIEERVGVRDGRWPLSADAVNGAMRSIQARGFAGDVYGTPLADWEDLLFGLARAALSAAEAAYLTPLEDFAHDKSWWQPSGAVL